MHNGLRIKKQPPNKFHSLPSSSTITPHLLKRKNMPESPKVKQKLKKKKKKELQWNQHGFLLSSYRITCLIKLSPPNSSFSLSQYSFNFPNSECKLKKNLKKCEEKSWRKIQMELWIFMCYVGWGNSNNLSKSPLRR